MYSTTITTCYYIVYNSIEKADYIYILLTLAFHDCNMNSVRLAIEDIKNKFNMNVIYLNHINVALAKMIC